MKLQDRVAIVTGAAQGIGRAVAQKLSDEGAKVVVADINGPGAEKAAAELPGALGLVIDVSEARRRAAHGRRDRLRPRQGRRAGQRRGDRAVRRLATTSRSRSGAVSCPSDLDGVFLTIKAVEKPMRQASYGRIIRQSIAPERDPRRARPTSPITWRRRRGVSVVSPARPPASSASTASPSNSVAPG